MNLLIKCQVKHSDACKQIHILYIWKNMQEGVSAAKNKARCLEWYT